METDALALDHRHRRADRSLGRPRRRRDRCACRDGRARAPVPRNATSRGARPPRNGGTSPRAASPPEPWANVPVARAAAGDTPRGRWTADLVPCACGHASLASQHALGTPKLTGCTTTTATARLRLGRPDELVPHQRRARALPIHVAHGRGNPRRRREHSAPLRVVAGTGQHRRRPVRAGLLGNFGVRPCIHTNSSLLHCKP